MSVLRVIDRICGLVSKGYYTGWFRYCLPSIDVTILQNELSGNENYRLGFFITDSSGQWLHHWRVKFDNERLAREGVVHVDSPVQIPTKHTWGVEYWLHLAVNDDYQWDFRGVEKIRLLIE